MQSKTTPLDVGDSLAFEVVCDDSRHFANALRNSTATIAFVTAERDGYVANMLRYLSSVLSVGHPMPASLTSKDQTKLCPTQNLSISGTQRMYAVTTPATITATVDGILDHIQ